MFAERLTAAAWKTKPAWVVISKNDQMLPPAMEESAAKKMGATTIALSTCHLAMLEQPDKVAAVIADAATKSLRAAEIKSAMATHRGVE
jgi:pimeloyl-ACP methyl ester carboxylesterase